MTRFCTNSNKYKKSLNLVTLYLDHSLLLSNHSGSLVVSCLRSHTRLALRRVARIPGPRVERNFGGHICKKRVILVISMDYEHLDPTLKSVFPSRFKYVILVFSLFKASPFGCHLDVARHQPALLIALGQIDVELLVLLQSQNDQIL